MLVISIFSKLEKIYLQKWTDQFATEKAQKNHLREWQIALSDYTTEDINRCISGCRDYCKWPPSIAEFKSFSGKQYRTPAYRQFKALQKPRCDKQIAMRHIQKIRDVL